MAMIEESQHKLKTGLIFPRITQDEFSKEPGINFQKFYIVNKKDILLSLYRFSQDVIIITVHYYL